MTDGRPESLPADEADRGGYDVVVLLPTGDGAGVASDDGSAALSLPRVAVEGEPDTDMFVAAVAGRLGDDHPPLLRIVPLTEPGTRPGLALVELEPLAGAADAAAPPPDGLVWRTLTPAVIEAAEPSLARPYLDRWLAERAGTSTGPGRPPWSKPGWLARSTTWMAEQLTASGTPLLAAPRIHYLWGLSAVVRGETAAGSVFMKACSPVFPTEAAITRTLAAADPDLLPTVLASDDTANLLLMRDLGQSFVGDAPVAQWPGGLVAHAAIQRRWLDRTAVLVAAGFERRGLAELAGQIPALPDLPLLASLASDDRRRLTAAIPHLLAACERLAEIGPPETIVHGDLHPWNVANAGGRSVVFDWSDSCIGHPFIDLATYVGRTRDTVARRACVDAYLGAWSDLLAPAVREEAVRLALPLGALHQVESYRRILAGLAKDDYWDLEGAAPSYARQALLWLDGGLTAEIGVHE